MQKRPVIVVLLLIAGLTFGGCVPLPGSSEGVIEDLTSIGIAVESYPGDTSPSDGGLNLVIIFYNPSKEPVTFKSIPVDVTIELYGAEDIMYLVDPEQLELVYQVQTAIDHSMTPVEMLAKKYIRIPFADMNVDQGKYCPVGPMKVTVTTPKQGDFQATANMVMLYPTPD